MYMLTTLFATSYCQMVVVDTIWQFNCPNVLSSLLTFKLSICSIHAEIKFFGKCTVAICDWICENPTLPGFIDLC